MPDTDFLTDSVRDWRDLVLRLQQMTRNDQGITMIRVDLAVLRGMPVWWSVGKKTVEPAVGATTFAKCLIGEFDGAGTA